VLESITCAYEDRIVHITPVVCRWLSGEPRPLGSDECRWVTAKELEQLDMPAVNAGIVRAALAQC
jgi:A/G-specific adenine glycosylase